MLPRTTLRARVPRLVYIQSTRLTSRLPLIRIEKGTFYKQYPTDSDTATNPPLYPNFSFILPSGVPGSEKKIISKPSLQHWAVIGPSGRTDLLDILRGQHISIPPDARSYPYLRSKKLAKKDPQLRDVSNAIRYIGFSGEGSNAIGGTRGAYLSARYESHREETDWTVEQFLRGQTSLNPMEGEEKGTIYDEALFRDVVVDLHLEPLLDMPVANLSNGQTRRARIAKALLRKPELLLLDEPFMGLDPATVRSISSLLHRLAEKCAPRLVLALRPQDPVPEWITHLILVGNSHRVIAQDTKVKVQHAIAIWQRFGFDSDVKNPEKRIIDRARVHWANGNLDEHLLQDLTSHQPQKASSTITASLSGEVLVEMEGVRVQYGEKAVLGDWKQEVNAETKDGLHWSVRRGQRWAILGSNGSGKTTLLSLITSDHPQTYALPIKLFGRSRLPEASKPGISIFEDPCFFPRQLTIREALESAFAETFLSKPKLNHERDLDVSAALRFFKPELDLNAAEDLPKVSTDTKIFPKLAPKLAPSKPVDSDARKRRSKTSPYLPLDHEIEYADHVRFGQLSTAQQRIVLFLRALIHKPDIVILDEAFSGLTATQRDKCLRFLEEGEGEKGSDHPRHQGLSEDQALVIISHVKEEIPDSVRFYMRLPSKPEDGSEALDFRCGMLKDTTVLRDAETWNLVWSSPSQFSQESCQTAATTHASDVDDQNDAAKLGYYTI
ncbi:hypothetical protein N7462_005241 [Penicillium macrosclerotiorum]|uniref:uncharacterized protein n=1 Tax=Penicillium macrosclerotiorum TaxID=303699 RepID=UPI0025472A5D|nr:uncharacterized protein N7462_005241 [Penicillium macrosclerotiorum]KAJ5690849.1 hypothetical protein N7462_005241 [Penicillium macrosclerotiorum]